jgi:hypothetical protein
LAGWVQLERSEEAELEAGQQQGGAGGEGAGGGPMQDAQQHEGDQRGVDLEAHGVFAAAPEGADLEVLLEPFEQQLNVPALFVEPRDLGGRALEIVGQQAKRLATALALDHHLAQQHLIERVGRRAAARPAMTDPDRAVGQDRGALGNVLGGRAAVGVLLAPGDKESLGRR